MRVDFDRRLKLEFHGAKITSVAGFLAYRELDDALGLSEVADAVSHDSRSGKNGWHGMVSQFRQSVFGRVGGYDDVNDAERLGRDPAMRWIVGGKAVERSAASTSQIGLFETELLATDANLEALGNMNGAWIDKVHDRRPPKIIILDMDSSVSPTHGKQEGSAYNGHFGCACYHPLFLFNQLATWNGVPCAPAMSIALTAGVKFWNRSLSVTGNVPCAATFEDMLPLPSRTLFEFLETENYKYVIRLKANKVLQDRVAHLLTRPVGRPPNHVRRYYASFSYRAGSWNKKRRVVAKVEWHPGELYPRRWLHRHRPVTPC